MSTLHQITFALAGKPYRILLEPLFTHTENDDFSAVSVTERSCAAPILKVERHVSDMFLYHSLAQCCSRCSCLSNYTG